MGTVPRSPNRLLANLTPADHGLVKPHLHNLELVHAKVLVAAGNEIKDAYFPHCSIISLVVRLIDGETTEVAMIGRDSVFGASAALAGPTALTTAIVQSPGMRSALPVKRLHAAAEQGTTFRATLIRHEQAILVQAEQSTGCMASHTAMARLAGCCAAAMRRAATNYSSPRNFSVKCSACSATQSHTLPAR